MLFLFRKRLLQKGFCKSSFYKSSFYKSSFYKSCPVQSACEMHHAFLKNTRSPAEDTNVFLMLTVKTIIYIHIYKIFIYKTCSIFVPHHQAIKKVFIKKANVDLILEDGMFRRSVEEACKFKLYTLAGIFGEK